MKMKPEVNKIFVSTLVLTLGIFSWPVASRGASAPKEPTVEDCVERTGLSEEKCSEMIEKFKNMTPEERAKMGPQGSRGGGAGRPPSAEREKEERPPMKESAELGDSVDIETQIERAEKAKSTREGKFSQMEERLEKILEYLKSQGIDISEAESNVNILKEKAANILSACDAYVAALEVSRDNNEGKLTDAAREAREKIRELSDDLRKFFRETLLPNLKSLIEKLSD